MANVQKPIPIPEPINEVNSLWRTAQALKEAVEVMQGIRGTREYALKCDLDLLSSTVDTLEAPTGGGGGGAVFAADIDSESATDGYVLTADGASGADWEVAPAGGGGGTEFLTITEFDDTDATYYYYGGLDTALDWKVNRYHKTTYIKTSADEASNPTKTSLALAWTDRGTLSYA